MSAKDYSFLGRHAIFDLELEKNHKYLCDPDIFFDNLSTACRNVGATVLNTQKHFFSGENAGYTFTIILAESHASCHTWPEHGIATFDIFMCGKCDPFEAKNIFLKSLDMHGYKVFETTLYRGYYYNK